MPRMGAGFAFVPSPEEPAAGFVYVAVAAVLVVCAGAVFTGAREHRAAHWIMNAAYDVRTNTD